MGREVRWRQVRLVQRKPSRKNMSKSMGLVHQQDRVLSPGGTNPACSRQLDEGPGIVKKGRGDSGCSPLL